LAGNKEIRLTCFDAHFLSCSSTEQKQIKKTPTWYVYSTEQKQIKRFGGPDKHLDRMPKIAGSTVGLKLHKQLASKLKPQRKKQA
jgi:hypothetical protein